jgi:murein DD-endopeptidase MepM/ murein hydrolase activator NlpD
VQIAPFGSLAHLRQGSIKVADGKNVNTGDRLALAGNSGNSS